MAAAPYVTAIPGAAGYAQADVLATNAYNKALAQLNQNRLNSATKYGYTGTVDPNTGVLNGLRVDPHSIYGQLQQLFHGQALEDRNAQYAAEDRGLHGGLAHQAASELRYQHGAQRTALGNAFQDELAGYQTQQQQAAETRDAALYQAQQQALSDELARESAQSWQDFLNSFLSGPGGSGGTPSGPAANPHTNEYFNPKTKQFQKGRPATGHNIYAV